MTAVRNRRLNHHEILHLEDVISYEWVALASIWIHMVSLISTEPGSGRKERQTNQHHDLLRMIAFN